MSEIRDYTKGKFFDWENIKNIRVVLDTNLVIEDVEKVEGKFGDRYVITTTTGQYVTMSKILFDQLSKEKGKGLPIRAQVTERTAADGTTKYLALIPPVE